MEPTPLTDAEVERYKEYSPESSHGDVPGDFCREIERRLNAALRELAALKEPDRSQY